MGLWSDIATWRGPTVNHGGPSVEQRGVVLHRAEGSFEGTIAWCRNSRGAEAVSAHFVIANDGRIAQVLDTAVTAWTQREGNGRWLSIETEGHTPHALTPAQVDACARILAKAHQVYGVPLQLATSPSGRGLGHHSMGAEHGVNWGHSECPGPAVKEQKPAILARAIQLAGGAPPAPTPSPTQEAGEDEMRYFSITDHGPRFQHAGRYSGFVYEFADTEAELSGWRGSAPTEGITHAEFAAGKVGTLDGRAVRALLAGTGAPSTPSGKTPHHHDLNAPGDLTGAAIWE